MASINDPNQSPRLTGVLAAYVARLVHGLSAARLQTYRPSSGGDLEMVTAYFWNVALCQALYPSIGALEVSMRNGIHDALTTRFGTPTWFDRPKLLLARELTQIIEVKRTIQRSGKSLMPDRIVAGVNYGFWTSILGRGYGNAIWAEKNPAVLVQMAFPHAPAHFQVRGRVHERFNTIRSLRNRIFHFEPIWRGVRLASGKAASLPILHADVMDAIGWVDPSLQATVVALDTFPSTYQNGQVETREKILRYLTGG